MYTTNDRRPRWCVVLLLLWTKACAAASDPAAEPEPYRWISLPIEVAGLPPRAAFVPVACPVDFGHVLRQSSVAGVIDERSLRLYRVLPDGSEVEEPVQFEAAHQPRLGPQLLPGTAPGVSYVAEFHPEQAPPGLKQTGTLSWIARSDAEGGQRYRLQLGVPRGGRAIQVPFAPQNLRVFDEQGRATPIRSFPRMQIRPQWPLNGAVHVLDAQKLVTTYHVGPTPAGAEARGKAESVAGPALPGAPIRRPFFYPVNGPDGIGLTEFGKPHDPTGSHAHHYSLWIAHANVAGQDFWSERGGIIAHQQLEQLEDGPVSCRLVQATRWIAKGVDQLRERRRITVYRAAADFRLIDFELEFTAPRAEPVELGKTTFGFLAVRVAQSMTPFDGGGEILNARGDRNEQQAHLKRAEWLDQSGPIAPASGELGAPGRKAGDAGSHPTAPARWGGIAVLDHPGNPNHPTVWHCRNDGWAGAAFNAEGPYAVRPGKPLRLRYRLCLHRGSAADARVADHYAAFAARPVVRLGVP